MSQEKIDGSQVSSLTRSVRVQLSIRLASRPTWRVLSTVAAALAVGHSVAMILTLWLGYDSSVVRLLDLNEERSFGTAYSVALLGGSALLLLVLALVARKRGGDEARDARWWGGLAVIFAFMSADEAGGIHESLIVPLRQALHASGVLYFTWVVPYAALVLATGLLYTRFLLRLPRAVAVRFVIAGVIFVGGALGMELIAGWMTELTGYNYRSLLMELEYLVEETMEMLGVAYFVAALLRYVELGGGPLLLAVAMPDAEGSEPLTPSEPAIPNEGRRAPPARARPASSDIPQNQPSGRSGAEP
jgi:hypothetical protein